MNRFEKIKNLISAKNASVEYLTLEALNIRHLNQEEFNNSGCVIYRG